ncbi:MAG: right-handed parallel beta-helix repeat-containing protein, partial [Anaerolineales bacterium]|nr:right-handed parallel beta-helix repeat-containing protein [Anaerolineales bacterium]
MMLRRVIGLILVLVGGIYWNLDRQAVGQQQEQVSTISTTVSAEVTAVPAVAPRVWLEAPATAVTGESFTVKVMAENVANLGGFEVRLAYDPAQLALRTAVTNPALAGPSDRRTLLDMGVVRQPDGLVWAAATCPAVDCAGTAYQDVFSDEPGVSGRLELGTFEFAARSSEAQTIDLADLLLIDTNGRPLGASAAYQAELTASSQADTAVLDLSGNRVVNDADAYLVVDVWRDLAKNGRCSHPNVTHYDINNSGCLNVADVQTILAAWGKPVGEFPAGANAVQASEATFTVNSSQDQSDTNPGDGVCHTSTNTCTLRAALEEANARTGSDTINFNIRTSGGSCPDLVTIYPSTTLTVDAYDNASLTIDGYSQCNASANSQWITGNAVIKIEIRGSNDAYEYGLHVLSPNNLIKGLSVYNWHRQVQVMGSRAHDNTLQGNFLGTNAANTFVQSAPTLEGEGLRIQINAHDNLIGGTTPAARNIIAGNDQDGLDMENTEANVIHNNYVGLKQTGDAHLYNLADGVDVAEGAANNLIGGLNPGERNVISGNGRDGIEISHDTGTQGNQFVGNFVGVRPDGTTSLPNRDRGVTFEDSVNHNDVYRNVIAGNGGDGVRFYTVFNNELYDNYIGVLPTGIGPLDVVPLPGTEDGLLALPNGSMPERGNGLTGVHITAGSQSNHITHNIIAYHPEYGIYLDTDKGYLSYGTCQVYYNTFSRNSLYDNVAQGI